LKRFARQAAPATDRVVFAPRTAWGEPGALVIGAEHHHLARVLRFQPGDEVTIVDGEGGRGVFRIVEIGKRETRCELLELGARDAPPRVAIELAPCVTRAQRMDWLVEKATELGAAAISPVLSERSIVKPKAADSEAHAERWERLAIAAMKQSRRASKPKIAAPQRLAPFLASRAHGSRLIVPWERARAGALAGHLRTRPLRDGERLTLLVGPEGGLSDAEVAAIAAAGGEIVSLGGAILRAETAAVALLAILLYEGGAI